MLPEQIRDFFKEFGSLIKKVFSSRTIPFFVVSFALFGILIYRLFVLQIINGDTYSTDYSLKMQRTIYTTGTRGNIYDCNGVLLAYSELSYNVVISDSGYYSSTKERNQSINSVLSKAIDIIEEHGDTVDCDFHICLDEHGRYYYDISNNSLLRFLRDVYGHSSISELTEAERNSTAEEAIEYLADYYGLDTSSMGRHKVIEILYIRYNMSSNIYQRYVTVTIASNISESTMTSILENEPELSGISIEEGSIRHYNYSVCMAHIVGYTGKVSESELEELQLVDDSYEANDIVGKAGIESAYETTLSGTKGYKTVLVDSVGRIQSVIEEVEPQRGEDVYLTIDAEYQQEIYDLLERRLNEILITNIVNSDSTYDSASGFVTLPVVEAYNALISNNMISMDEIATSDTESAVAVYSLFSSRKESVLTDIENELNGGTAYNQLSSSMQEYMKEVRSLLISGNILNSDKISSTDELSENWSDGTISLHDYLAGAIENEWVNIYNLDLETDYPTYEEVLEAVVAEAMLDISSDRNFDKLIYEELILNKQITGRQLFLILMEQGGITYTESEYVSIYNGASTYDFLMKKLKSREITAAQLALDPCSGSCIVEDPNTGRLLAMVTYPSYDNNYFSGSIDAEYYATLLDDDSSPLLNRCTQTKIAIGSTFKPCMAIAGFMEGVIDTNTLIDCEGIFDKVTPNIKCHVYPDGHGEDNVITALRDSCNVYFCEVGYRLSCLQTGSLNHSSGLAYIQKYADLLGLATKTGIQLPETNPKVSDYNAVVSSIGQGTHAYTSLNVARYISTIANRGTVYNTSIVLKTCAADGSDENVVEPVIYKSTQIDDRYWNAIETGMQQALVYYFGSLDERLPITLQGKSGTAQEDRNRGDHAIFMSYPRDGDGNCEIAIVSMLPYAYHSTNAGIMNYYATAAYYGVDLPSEVYFYEHQVHYID